MSEPAAEKNSNPKPVEPHAMCWVKVGVFLLAIVLVVTAAVWYGVDKVVAFGQGDPLRVAALIVFAVIGGVGYLLSGRIARGAADHPRGDRGAVDRHRQPRP